MDKITRNIEKRKEIKNVFTDLFDTLLHRTVHPYEVYRIWSKMMIGELGLEIDIIILYKIRLNAIETLTGDLSCNKAEIPYDKLVTDIYNRLINAEYLKPSLNFSVFFDVFSETDYLAEISVQFINEGLISNLSYLKEKGYRIFAISDFHLPKVIIDRVLAFHGIKDIFDDVFVSCDYGKSKENGNLYPYLLKETNSIAEKTAMLGDNKKSDFLNAAKNGIFAQYLKHTKHKIRNKKNLFGTVENDFKSICKKIERNCRKSNFIFSEYIIHFYFFTERLYLECRKKGVKDLFFLAREGHYLKELFDKYQAVNSVFEDFKINTHYLKVSRHAAMQVSFKEIEVEEFAYIKKKYDKMSTRDFLDSFSINSDTAELLGKRVNIDLDAIIDDFVSSDVLESLKREPLFVEHYNKNRKEQNHAFKEYLNSFNVDFHKNGVTLVDVGWGGTMQECIHEFLGGTIAVTGYYIGLKEIYTITEKTKRFGLNFSIYPYRDFSDEILLANGQLYEQLLAAPHGSTVGYSVSENSPTIEFHEANEKKIFESYIAPIQDFMNLQFDKLCKELRPISYSQEIAQKYMTNMALRLGLLAGKKKIKFIHQISQGFYQNVGANEVGINYDPNELGFTKSKLLGQFIISPEKIFRYLVKIKPFLFRKNKFWMGWILNLSYYHIKLNRWLKERFFRKKLL
ncbi:HAD family hydrolase [Maribacter sp. 2210JD10-5]|uniref:HAD family hydrolase n=1 Tax=Maribacter sp. 2210JD10-5 TaxID=3386272 RepID=UPI0039BD7CEB